MHYKLNVDKLAEVIGLLANLLNIKITFFDYSGNEVEGLNHFNYSKFCAEKRKESPDFDRCCMACDSIHQKQAIERHEAVIYQCHAKLWDGVVPLYSRHNIYLGSIAFGQAQDEDGELPDLRRSSRTEMGKIARLLKIVSEYINNHEMIEYKNYNWIKLVDEYINMNWNKKITLKMLADVSNCSVSYISHKFPQEFGSPFSVYLKKLRLSKAHELLSDGLLVKEVASAAGFYDEFHFSREYKKYYGISPSGRMVKICR